MILIKFLNYILLILGFTLSKPRLIGRLVYGIESVRCESLMFKKATEGLAQIIWDL